MQVDAGGVATVAWQAGGAIEAKRYDAAEAALARRGDARVGGRRDRLGRAARRRRGRGRHCGLECDGRVGYLCSEPSLRCPLGAPTLLSPKVGTAYAPQLAVAPGGVATVVWYAQADGKFVVRARRWTGDRWDPVATLSNPSTNAGHPRSPWTRPVARPSSGAAQAPRRRSRRAVSTAPGALGLDRPVRLHRRRCARDRGRSARRRARRLATPDRRHRDRAGPPLPSPRRRRRRPRRRAGRRRRADAARARLVAPAGWRRLGRSRRADGRRFARRRHAGRVARYRRPHRTGRAASPRVRARRARDHAAAGGHADRRAAPRSRPSCA